MKIAIAGGIGSGKSLVTRYLRELGAKVVVADEVNAELLQDAEYIALIANNFPSVVHNNAINKKELADIVYHNEEKRRLLMDLAHPRIFRKMFLKYPDSKIVFYEIPLLAGAEDKFDRILYVDAPIDDRLARIVKRDNVSEEYAERIVSLQKGEYEMLDKATYVIFNNSSAEELQRRVKALYCSILEQFS